MCRRRGGSNPPASWSITSTGSATSRPTTRLIATRAGSRRPPPYAAWRAADRGRRVRYVRLGEYVRNRGRRLEMRPDEAVERRPAGVAELADALDLGSSDENRGGSNPPARTTAAVDRDLGR